MLQQLRSFGRGIGELLFPNSCLICDSPASKSSNFRHGLCNDCYGAVRIDPLASCARCGLSVGPHADRESGCMNCRGESLGFDSVVRLGTYEGRLRDSVLCMKSGAGEALAEMMGRVFGETAGEALLRERIDSIVPIPLHWRRLWSRGHNQSAAVARELAAGLQVPLESRLLRRVRHTPQQMQPSAAARRENVRGAFHVRSGDSLTGKRILLVDDVMTTGSTAGEAARMLKKAGASLVRVAILARR